MQAVLGRTGKAQRRFSGRDFPFYFLLYFFFKVVAHNSLLLFFFSFWLDTIVLCWNNLDL